jgi:[calcium/calmodulin-dependent protein kinase] kinase
LQETYDKIANDPVKITSNMSPGLVDLIQRLLCKDPAERITLEAAAEHPWVTGADGPVSEFMCRCGFGCKKRNVLQEAVQ